MDSSVLSVTAQRLAGEIFEDSRGAHDFARALGKRLAFLARQQLAEFLRALHDDVARTVENVGTHLRRCLRPGRERLARGLHRAIDVGRGRLWIARDDIVEIGRVDALADGIAGKRFAADEMGQGVGHGSSP